MIAEKTVSSVHLDGLDLKALMSSGLNDPDTENETPPELPGYEVLEKIGRGGMGSVYLAVQLSLDRLVAVKVITASGFQRDLLIDRLEREARVMAKLTHPNLVAVYDFLKLEEGRAAIVMEFVRGGNLREYYATTEAGTVPIDDIVTVGHQVASCLAATHAVGVVHRDIKPENLMLDSEGKIRVSDFGLALDDESMRLTASGLAVGTLGYSAPEQLEAADTDERADVFSLGVVLYEMLTGRKPMGAAARPSTLRKAVPPWLERTILDALQPDPALRIQTIAELQRRFETQAEPQSPAAPAPAQKNPSRRWWLAAAAGAPLVGAAVIFGPKFFDKTSTTVPATSIPVIPVKIRGNWRSIKNPFLSGNQECMLGISKNPDIFDTTVTLEFTRLSGSLPVALFFRHPNGYGTLLLDAYGRGFSGLEGINGQALNEPDRANFIFKITNDQRYTWSLRLAEDHIISRVKGDKNEYKIPIPDAPLSIVHEWKLNREQREILDEFSLAIGSFRSPTEFHSVKIERSKF